jgi:hypothetical protein
MGVQGLPAKGIERRLGFRRQKGGFGTKTAAIDLVAHDRMADRGQMHPNLVGAAGFQPAGQEARHRRFGLFRVPGPADTPGPGLARIALQHLPMGDGLAPALAHRHALAGLGVTVDRLVDGAVGAVGRPPDEGEIAPLERLASLAMVGELRRQRLVGAVVLRHHHHAGGVLVEPVHDAGAALAADARKAIAAMGDQRIDQGAGPIAGGGMNDEVAGFVDHDDVVVFVNHAERNGLGGGLGRLRRRHVDRDGGAGIDPIIGIADRVAVERDGAGLDQRFEPRPGQLGDMAGEHAVKPLAGLRRGDHDRFLRYSVCHDPSNLMTQVSNNDAAGNPPFADAGTMVARARLMMIISALTTLIAIAAVVSVIGYRVFNNGGPVGLDGIVTLPKGARVVSTSASAGRIAVLIDVNGASELRTFDIKTLKQTGRLQFATEP